MICELRDEAAGIVARLLDGAMSFEDKHRLNEILFHSPEARDYYLDMLSLHSNLHRIFESDLIEVPVSIKLLAMANRLGETKRNHLVNRFREWGRIATAMSALVAVALVTVALVTVALVTVAKLSTPIRNLAQPKRFESESEKRQSQHVAMLVLSEGSQWENRLGYVEGERLSKGRIRMKSGVAVIRFDGGAELVLNAPVEIDVTSVASAQLLSGHVAVRAERGAEGFVLKTPACNLLDLGTEFVVKVSTAGVTELQVVEGEVAVTDSRLHLSDGVVHAGTSMRINPTSGENVSLDLAIVGFSQLLKQANSLGKQPTTLAYEGFRYGEGIYPPEQLNGGSGWTGPWRLRNADQRWPEGEQNNPRLIDSTENMRIVSNQEGSNDFDLVSSLGALEMPAGQAFRLRSLTNPVKMDTDGLTYVSLLIQNAESSVIRRGPPECETGNYVRFSLRSMTDYWGQSMFIGLTPSMHPHINVHGFGAFNSLSVIPNDQPMRWVGKIVRRSIGEDEIFFRVYAGNDALDSTEPATWHVSTRGLFMDRTLDVVVVTNIGPSAKIIDEILIGPSW